MKEQECLMIMRTKHADSSCRCLPPGLRHAEALERCLGRASCAAKILLGVHCM